MSEDTNKQITSTDDVTLGEGWAGAETTPNVEEQQQPVALETPEDTAAVSPPADEEPGATD